MGRPKADDPKTLTLRVRVTPQEKVLAKEMAAALGVSVSDFLRGFHSIDFPSEWGHARKMG